MVEADIISSPFRYVSRSLLDHIAMNNKYAMGLSYRLPRFYSSCGSSVRQPVDVSIMLRLGFGPPPFRKQIFYPTCQLRRFSVASLVFGDIKYTLGPFGKFGVTCSTDNIAQLWAFDWTTISARCHVSLLFFKNISPGNLG